VFNITRDLGNKLTGATGVAAATDTANRGEVPKKASNEPHAKRKKRQVLEWIGTCHRVIAA